MTSQNLFPPQARGRIAHVFLVFLFGLLTFWPVQGQSEPKPPSHYGDLPLSFEPNQGQAAEQADFLAHIDGSLALFDRRGVSLWFAPEQQALHSPLICIQVHLLHTAVKGQFETEIEGAGSCH